MFIWSSNVLIWVEEWGIIGEHNMNTPAFAMYKNMCMEKLLSWTLTFSKHWILTRANERSFRFGECTCSTVVEEKHKCKPLPMKHDMALLGSACPVPHACIVSGEYWRFLWLWKTAVANTLQPLTLKVPFCVPREAVHMVYTAHPVGLWVTWMTWKLC